MQPGGVLGEVLLRVEGFELAGEWRRAGWKLDPGDPAEEIEQQLEHHRGIVRDHEVQVVGFPVLEPGERVGERDAQRVLQLPAEEHAADPAVGLAQRVDEFEAEVEEHRGAEGADGTTLGEDALRGRGESREFGGEVAGIGAELVLADADEVVAPPHPAAGEWAKQGGGEAVQILRAHGPGINQAKTGKGRRRGEQVHGESRRLMEGDSRRPEINILEFILALLARFLRFRIGFENSANEINRERTDAFFLNFIPLAIKENLKIFIIDR